MPRLVCLLLVFAFPASGWAGVPVIYSTDLYHPHDDPDDHYDLATLFALPELDVKGVIIDMSNMGEIRENQRTGNQASGKQPGIVALQQIFHLAGKTAPIALGLDQPLHALEDQALDQPESAQGGVRMILSTLRASPEKVSIFTVGSVRDVAAAYNRDPQLLRSKVQAVYVNAGTGPDRYQEEWNVRLDPTAYRRLLLSDLPIQWYPCFGRDDYLTYFRVDQSAVVGACAAPIKAYFEYALTRSQQDPLEYLKRACSPPTGPRNMWCTASFIDLAGRKIYKTEKGFEALASPPTADSTPITCFAMQPVKLTEATAPIVPIESANGIKCQYVGNLQDLVGKTDVDPDGIPDCLVRVQGLDKNKTVRGAMLSGPREGIWLSSSRKDPRRWLLKTQWKGGQLMVAFTYWAAGTHQLELTFDDGSQQSVSFHVPPPNSPWFAADLEVAESNVRVFRKREPEYSKVMTSCLKNILDSFPIVASSSSANER